MPVSPDNKYTNMQKNQYNIESARWSVNEPNHVIGDVPHHNAHQAYSLLFNKIPNHQDKVVLDFGCGPGRNLVKYSTQFKKIDGVDIARQNLLNARKWIEHHGLNVDNYDLYECNGVDLREVPENKYDIIMSTICLQHICVHEIRYNYFKEFFRLLKPNGSIAIQMGFGDYAPETVDYYANNYDALSTNRGCDAIVSNPSQLEKDLTEIGFVNFQYQLGPPCHDSYPYWIFFNATKPS